MTPHRVLAACLAPPTGVLPPFSAARAVPRQSWRVMRWIVEGWVKLKKAEAKQVETGMPGLMNGRARRPARAKAGRESALMPSPDAVFVRKIVPRRRSGVATFKPLSVRASRLRTLVRRRASRRRLVLSRAPRGGGNSSKRFGTSTLRAGASAARARFDPAARGARLSGWRIRAGNSLGQPGANSRHACPNISIRRTEPALASFPPALRKYHSFKTDPR